MSAKELAALFSIIISIAGSTNYILKVLRHTTKPHVFSWAIWSLLMLIGAAAQFAGHAGWGAYATGFGGLMNFIIMCLAFYYGEKTITRSDWISFLGALSAIPLWVITKNPLSAVLLVTVIDGLGYYPTFRKSYYKPNEENLASFTTFTFSALMALLAVENYSLTTSIYPVYNVTANALVVLLLIFRRHIRSAGH